MAKDACYRKVKARYKVFPSAYASGAIAKCRKVGAKNWGNKSKKAEGGVVKMSNGGGISNKFKKRLEATGRAVAMDELDKIIKNMKKDIGSPRFTVDSKGNVKKNFKNGGNVSKGKVARGCGAVMRRKKTFYG
tara:strand:- start:1537 stop:1935 length:399 start_codon:yes stop_codon:yes gene_type:complete